MLVEIGIHISIRILPTEFLLDIGCPRHEQFQFFVGLVFLQVRQLHQHMLEISKRFNTVCLCTFHQGIHNGAGLSSFCGIAEQPVLSAKGKGADGVLCQVVGDRHFAIAQKCRKRLLLVQAIAYRFLQFASLFRMDCFQPRIILLQKGQFLVLAVFLAIFWFIGSAFPLLCKQLVAVLEANGGLAYRKAGYSKKFRAEHEADILLHQTAKKAFDELGMKKLPTVKSLQTEYAELMAQKKAAYSGYRQARDEMKELLTVKANVDRIMGYEEEKQTEKDHSQEQRQGR